jgi:hypothetical protein
MCVICQINKRFETPLKSKLKIPVPNFIIDLNDDQVSDQNIMKKYGLDHRQLVFVLGKLAETRRISFKRVVFVVRRYLDVGEFEKAEVCLKVIKKYFAGSWGVQAMVRGLEHDLQSLKSRKKFQEKMDKTSKSIEWFKEQYPGVFLHPVVVSSVKVLDYYANKLENEENIDVTILKLLDARLRLSMYPHYDQHFAGYTTIEALRFWHFISLKLFSQEKISHFFIRSIMDPDTRDVCMHLDGTCLSVNEVLIEAVEQNMSGKLLHIEYFPALMDVEELHTEQKTKVLMENGWYLPPFCENCRCQILPC